MSRVFLGLFLLLGSSGCNMLGGVTIHRPAARATPTPDAPPTFQGDVTDDDNSSEGFGGGTALNVLYSVDKLTLDPALTSGGLPFDNSWTPHYNEGTNTRMLSHWAMDNDWLDSTGTNHGTPHSAPTFTSHSRVGTHAGAFSAGAWLSVDGAAALNGAVGSISLWVKTSSFSAIYNTTGGSSNQNTLFKNGTDLSLRLCGGTVCNELLVPASRITDNQWHHIVTTWLSGGDRVLYLDGVRVAAESGTATFLPGSDLEIAYCSWGCGSLDGNLDEMATWNVQLSDAEVQNIYARQAPKYVGQFNSRTMNYESPHAWTGLNWITTLPFGKELPDGGTSESITHYADLPSDLMTGIVGLWHANDTGPTTLVDSSGNGNHGTVSGTVTFAEAGMFRNGIYFDGSNSYIQTPNTVPDPQIFTESTWFQVVSGSSAGGNFTSFGDGGADRQLYIDTSGHVGLTIYNTLAATVSVTSPSTYNDGQWHHAVGMHTGTRMNLYVDGELVAFDPSPGAPVSYDGRWLIGICPWPVAGTQRMTGNLDEIAIWQRALSASEVLSLYRRGANRLQFQTRTCTTTDCSDRSNSGDWLGPDGSNQSYFSELHNNSAFTSGGVPTGNVFTNAPALLFSWFTNLSLSTRQYFQYRILFESDDLGTSCNGSWCSPELSSVSVRP